MLLTPPGPVVGLNIASRCGGIKFNGSAKIVGRRANQIRFCRARTAINLAHRGREIPVHKSAGNGD